MGWYTAVKAFDTSDATATSNDIRKNKTAYINNKLVSGTMPELDSVTYTPSSKDQIIASGVYLVGDQIIKGDSNLVSDNIIKNKSIFGITGNQVPIEFDTNSVASLYLTANKNNTKSYEAITEINDEYTNLYKTCVIE